MHASFIVSVFAALSTASASNKFFELVNSAQNTVLTAEHQIEAASQLLTNNGGDRSGALAEFISNTDNQIDHSINHVSEACIGVDTAVAAAIGKVLIAPLAESVVQQATRFVTTLIHEGVVLPSQLISEFTGNLTNLANFAANFDVNPQALFHISDKINVVHNNIQSQK